MFPVCKPMRGSVTVGVLLCSMMAFIVTVGLNHECTSNMSIFNMGESI